MEQLKSSGMQKYSSWCKNTTPTKPGMGLSIHSPCAVQGVSLCGVALRWTGVPSRMFPCTMLCIPHVLSITSLKLQYIDVTVADVIHGKVRVARIITQLHVTPVVFVCAPCDGLMHSGISSGSYRILDQDKWLQNVQI